jgi:hypothetical protein
MLGGRHGLVHFYLYLILKCKIKIFLTNSMVEQGRFHAMTEIRHCCQTEFGTDLKTYFLQVLVIDIDVAI